MALATIGVLGKTFGSRWQQASVVKERQVDIVIVGSGSAELNAMAHAREVGRSPLVACCGSTPTVPAAGYLAAR
jgi:hypothetical protein